MKKIILLVIVALLFLTVSIVMAVPPGPRQADNRGPDTMRYKMRGRQMSPISRLTLTTEQKDQVKELQESRIKESAPIKAELIKKQTELRLLWMEDNPDPEKIKAKQKELLGLKGQIQDKMTDFRLEFRNILTPEQKAQIIAGGSGFRKKMKSSKRLGSFRRMRSDFSY